MSPDFSSSARATFEQIVQSVEDAGSAGAGAVATGLDAIAAGVQSAFGQALQDLGIDPNDFDGLTDQSRAALLAFLDALGGLKAAAGDMNYQYGRVQQEVLGQPYRVAVQPDKVEIVLDLYAKMQVVNNALQLIFADLNALIETFPDAGRQRLRDRLHGLDPRFDAWLASA